MGPTGRWWPASSRARRALEENGIDAEGAEIILRREILQNGKGRVYVNNQPATVAVLRQLAPELALVHAQSETLGAGGGAFDAAQQRGLLDRFAGIAVDGGLAVLANGQRVGTSRTGCGRPIFGVFRAGRSRM